MNILLISSSFYPQTSPRSFRTTELVKEFCRQGHEVTLVTYYNETNHRPFLEKYNVNIINLGSSNLNVFSLGGKSKLSMILSRIINRALLFFFAYPDIKIMWDVNKAIKKLPKKSFDLLISVAVPHPTHWGVALAYRRGHKIAHTWVADCGDPFMGDRADSFRKLFYFKYVEKMWCSLVDFISVPFEGAKDGYYSEFIEKIRVIPQGFNFDETKASMVSYKKNTLPTFVYAGNFIPKKRDPRPILEYLNALDLDFKFIIYNNNIDYIKDLIEAAKGKIETHSYIPREDLLKVLSTADFVLNIENSGISENLPSKLIDYALVGRPILSLDCNNIDYDSINAFLDGNYAGQLVIEELDKYNIKNVVKQFSKLSE